MEDAAVPLGKFVAACEARALARHGATGRFSVAVSGGSLPKVCGYGVLRSCVRVCVAVRRGRVDRRVALRCSQTLAAALETSKNVLHFERWTVLYADERCVALDGA